MIIPQDSYQSVYNWQYISCIHLWSRVLGELHDDALAPLIYPLVQVTLGVIRFAWFLYLSQRCFKLKCYFVLMQLICVTIRLSRPVALNIVSFRLIPTARYYPLRFHCLHSLTVLAKSTDTYIPIASHLLQVRNAEFSVRTSLLASFLACLLASFLPGLLA